MARRERSREREGNIGVIRRRTNKRRDDERTNK